jgi:hypothetical protein
MTPEERADLLFALAKASADVGRNEESFRYYLDANRAMRGVIRYNEAAVLGGYESLSQSFTSELFSAKANLGDPSSRPIFIVGMPRSGSSLIEQILASHRDVFGAGENPFFLEAVSSTLAGVGADPNHLTADRLRALGADYLRRVAIAAPQAPRLADKMLSNDFFAGLIHLALPNARIIHAVRDPLDTCLSIFSRHFGATLAYAYDLAEIGRFYRAERHLMAHWRSVLPAHTLIEMRYEDIVADLEGQVRRMLDFCDLDWDPACLSFETTPRAVWTSSATQVRQPIYRSAIGRWRPSAELLKPLLDGLGEYADETSVA